jgi:hypothetical protein
MKFLNANPVATFLATGVRGDLDFYADGVTIKQHKTFTDANRGTTINLIDEQDISFDQLRSQMFTDPAGLNEVRVDKTFDLTTLGAAYQAVCVVPAGSIVKLALFQILVDVAVASTGDSLAIGTHATTPAALLQGATTLTKNYQKSKCQATAVATQTTYDLCATKNSDGSLSDQNITLGKVRVVIVYETPAVLDNV